MILCEDTRVAKKLLMLLAQKYTVDFEKKRYIALHEHNQQAFLQKITPDFFSQDVVYMSDAGMPAISDPGALLVEYAQINNIPYTVLPGPSAAITAYAASGMNETKFCFFGFLPHKGKERQMTLQNVLEQESNVILYEAPHRLLKLLGEICAIDPDRELFLAKELTKKYERYYWGRAKELKEQLQNESIKGEWVVIIKKSATSSQQCTLLLDDIINLSLPKKEKAKLLAKVTQKSIKEWYETLTKE